MTPESRTQGTEVLALVLAAEQDHGGAVQAVQGAQGGGDVGGFRVVHPQHVIVVPDRLHPVR